MANLVLTDKEIKDNSYLEWSDEALGKLVKMTALKIQDKHGTDAAILQGAAVLIINLMKKSKASDMTLTCKGVTYKGVKIGDFEVLIKQIGE